MISSAPAEQSSVKKRVTVVIPVYNEEANLPEVYRRVSAVVAGLPQHDFTILQIDNGSLDGSGDKCIEFCKTDPRWKYVRFSRNFGIEASFFAGATYADGDALIYLFSDLQDPPEKIPEMIEQWEQGYDVVYGVLTKRQDNQLFKSWGAFLAYRLIFLLSEYEIPVNATDFRLLSRRVIEVLKNCKERTRYMRGITHWAGFSQTSFTFERAPRRHGRSNAGLLFCIRYAFNAILSFSSKPLRVASLVGVLATLLSLLGCGMYVLHLILTSWGWNYGVVPPPAGWTTLVLLVLFFGGVQCLFLGILGEYLAQVQIETKARPSWIVARSEGISV
jgi:glycosyltransferase involved in cell wall biosynthesis